LTSLVFQQVVNLDTSSEVRTRQILGELGSTFYKQWAGLLTGRGDGVDKDPLGLGDSFYSQVRPWELCRRAFSLN